MAARCSRRMLAALLGTFCSHAAAQGASNTHPALPAPPAEKAAAAASARTPQMREQERRKIVEALNEAVKKLKALDVAAAAPSLEGQAVDSAKLSASVREASEREVNALRRKLTQFDLETICGPSDDSQEVELYDGKLGPTQAFVQMHQPSTAQIQWRSDFGQQGANFDPGDVAGVRWCTGSLIAENILLTAGHCFDINANNWTTPSRGGQKLPPRELALLMQVNFNYQVDGATKKLRPEVTYPVTRLIEHREGPNKLDYAIVELGKGAAGDLPGNRFGRIAFDATNAALQNAKLLTVIQHPEGRPKRVAAGSSIGLVAGGIEYSDIDTLGGASGSGVIDQNGRVIGVHVRGGCTATGGANGAVSLEAIAAVSKVVK